MTIGKRSAAIFSCAALLSACARAPSTLSLIPSSLHVRQTCPAATYDVLDDFNLAWTGVGFLGLPLNDTPNIPKMIDAEIQRQGGDAVIDVDASGNLYMAYFLLWVQLHPRVRVSGKVIRFTNNACRDGGAGR